MLALEEGEEVLFILQIMFCCWLPEEEGVSLVDIMVWMVRPVQLASVVWGKNPHKFASASYHGGVGVPMKNKPEAEEARTVMAKIVPV